MIRAGCPNQGRRSGQRVYRVERTWATAATRDAIEHRDGQNRTRSGEARYDAEEQDRIEPPATHDISLRVTGGVPGLTEARIKSAVIQFSKSIAYRRKRPACVKIPGICLVSRLFICKEF